MGEFYEHTNITAIAAFLHQKIDESYMTQKQFAKKVGYDNPNMVSMIKHGTTKMPLEKVPIFAEVLEVDPGHLFRLALEQYWPDLRSVISRIFGCTVSSNEFVLITAIREASRNLDPIFTPNQIEAVIALLVGMGLTKRA